MSIDTSKLSEVLPHREQLPHTVLSAATRRFFEAVAGVLSWVWIGLIVVIVVNVTMRYLFGEGRIEFEEIQWHLYAVGFLVGLATAMDRDDHIRVDLFREKMAIRTRAWIELYGLLLLFFPFVVLLIVYSIPFVGYSFTSAEISDAPGGLPLRWVIKSALPCSMLLLMIAGASRLSRVTACLFGRPRNVS